MDRIKTMQPGKGLMYFHYGSHNFLLAEGVNIEEFRKKLECLVNADNVDLDPKLLYVMRNFDNKQKETLKRILTYATTLPQARGDYKVVTLPGSTTEGECNSEGEYVSFNAVAEKDDFFSFERVFPICMARKDTFRT